MCGKDGYMSRKYVKIKRHELKCLIEAQYGIAVRDMHESDRGIIIDTDQGTKMFKRYKRDDAKIAFAAAVYEYLHSRGFNNISIINKTLKGEYSVLYDAKAYLLQNFTPGKTYYIKEQEDAAKIGRILAELHVAGEGFIPPSGCQARVDWGKWMEKYKSYANNIKKFKEANEIDGTKTKFDKLFIKHADIYYDKMYKAYLVLKNFSYLEKVQQAMKTNQITHKQFRKHAVMFKNKSELFVCNMEDCAYDIPEIDIADLLESFSGNKKLQLAKAALEGYCEVKKLDRKSIKIIQAFIMQPKRFYKVVDRYYGKKKNYTETQLIQKLEKSIKRENKKDDLIEFLELFHI